MLEVYPIQDKNEQEKLLNKCGVKFDIEKMAYAAYVEGELHGVLQFAIKRDGGHIYDIANVIGIDDEESLFVMGRGALNFIDLCNVKTAYYDGLTAGKELLLKKIGFRQDKQGRWYMNLEGFFEAPCKHDADN